MSRARTKSSFVLPKLKTPLVPTISQNPSPQTGIDNADDADDDDDFGWPPGYEFPGRYEGCDRWCAPLHLVEKSVKGKPWAQYFDPNDFMIMSRLTDLRGTITHYKHVDTRRYINVDDLGKTYVYSESEFRRADKRYGYSSSNQLRAAVEQLGLWQLPWMREELFEDRLGLEWDDRWQHPNAPKRSPKLNAGGL